MPRILPAPSMNSDCDSSSPPPPPPPVDDSDDPLYKTEEFMMYCFKVLPCEKTYRHDWWACPYLHPGETAKRRDPRKYRYTAVACPNAKQGGHCPRGASCPGTHNVFEYWLHPTRFRTQFCDRGIHCSQPFCFFAHNVDQLRMPTANDLELSPSGETGAGEEDASGSAQECLSPQVVSPSVLSPRSSFNASADLQDMQNASNSVFHLMNNSTPRHPPVPDIHCSPFSQYMRGSNPTHLIHDLLDQLMNAPSATTLPSQLLAQAAILPHNTSNGNWAAFPAGSHGHSVPAAPHMNMMLPGSQPPVPCPPTRGFNYWGQVAKDNQPQGGQIEDLVTEISKHLGSSQMF